VEKYPATLVANLFLRCESCLTDNLTLGIGVYDVFDENPPFLQPYYGGHPPLPSAGREIGLQVEYRF